MMLNKYCPKCDTTLSVEKFSKSSSRKDGLNSYCKECHAVYRREHYEKNKQKYIKKSARWRRKQRIRFYTWLKTQKCTDCENNDFRVLEFDHVLGDKSYNISKKIEGSLLETLQEELDKCEIVCANCHRIRTAERDGYYKYMQE